MSSPPARRTRSGNCAKKRSPEPGSIGAKYVEIDKRYLRPAEVDILIGDASKAKRVLGWEPKTKFKELVRLMVDADVKLLEDKLAGKVAAVPTGRY